MDYVVVRPCRRGGYELRDQYGAYVGCAPTLVQAFRFADLAGVPVSVELETDQDDTRAAAGNLLRQWWRRTLALAARIHLF